MKSVSERKRKIIRRLKAPLLWFRGIFIGMINFYQRRLSHHTCLYTPSCSEYTKRCINNFGVLVGILMGIWRILRCNPLSKGGLDPAPELSWKRKWLV